MKKFALAALTALLFSAPVYAGGYLGVYMTEDRPQRGGALVEEVAPGSPAAEAGLRKGDMIVGCNGQQTDTSKAFIAQLTQANAGDTLQLRVERDGWGKDVAITLGRRPSADAEPAQPQPPVRVPQNRGFLGVYLRQGEQGEAVVDGVQDGSAADKGGLKTGDVIRKIAGVVVTEPSGVPGVLSRYGPGESVQIQVERGGQTIDLSVTLGHRQAEQTPTEPQADPAPTPRQPQPSAKQPPYIGVALDDKEGKGPLAVEDVAPNSPAEKFGLRTGDVVVGVDGQDVGTIEQFVKAMTGKFAGDTVVLRIERDGWRSDVRVTLGTRPDGE